MNSIDIDHEYIYNISKKFNMNNIMFQCKVVNSKHFYKFCVENMVSSIDESNIQEESRSTKKHSKRLPVFAILGKGCSPISEPKSSKRKFAEIS